MVSKKAVKLRDLDKKVAKKFGWNEHLEMCPYYSTDNADCFQAVDFLVYKKEFLFGLKTSFGHWEATFVNLYGDEFKGEGASHMEAICNALVKMNGIG